jgi:hypothetical protein
MHKEWSGNLGEVTQWHLTEMPSGQYLMQQRLGSRSSHLFRKSTTKQSLMDQNSQNLHCVPQWFVVLKSLSVLLLSFYFCQEMILTGTKKEVFGEEPILVSLCPPQIWTWTAQSVQRLATSWTVREWNASVGEIFRTLGTTQPPAQWVPNLFTGDKAAGRGVNFPPPSSTEVKERVELHLYSPSGPSCGQF